MVKNNQNTGRRGEDLAAEYLCGRGYRIIARNYRTRSGEIDIVATDGPVVCFIEVKTRLQARYGAPEESVQKHKQRHMARAALYFLKDRQLLDAPSRFDVVSIARADGNAHITLIRSAFVLDENDEVSDV